jgi:hypothetical protein
MKIQVEIDEDRLVNLVEAEIVRRTIEQNGHSNWDARIGIKHGTDKAIQEYIYANKTEIIERVVQRASTEIVKKGLPKLLAELGKGETDGNKS